MKDFVRSICREMEEVSFCVLASVPSVLVLISFVNLVCGVDLASDSVSECEVVEPQTFFFSQKRGASVVMERVQHKRTNA